jgi:hypothetical protein
MAKGLDTTTNSRLYSFRPEYPTPRSNLHEPFPGEVQRSALPPADIEEPEPYDLKVDSQSPQSPEQNVPLENEDGSTLSGSHEYVRPGDSSRSFAGTSLPPQTESTSRQIRLREEADALRERVAALEREAFLSDEIGRMKDYIQRLEMLIASNWARGLTDEPPPSYHA